MQVAEPAGPRDEVAGLRTKIEDYERWFRTLDGQICTLEREQQKLDSLVKHADFGMALLDSGLRVVWSNTVFRKQLQSTGPKPQDPLGLSCNQAICRKGNATCKKCPVARVFKNGKVAHHELNLVMGERIRPVYATATPVNFPDGSVEQVMVMLQDLSGLAVLRQSEEALRGSEQRFRSIFEQAGAGMITHKADGTFLRVSPTFCTMLGYTESELLRKKVTDLIHQDDMPEVITALNEARAGLRSVLEMEYRYIRRDDTPVWCQVTAVWQMDEQKHPSYSVALVQDISERKRAEQDLAQSQRRYQALVHSIDGIVWEADPRAFRFLFVSRQAERILGYPVERWLTQPRFWRNQIHPEDLERVRGALSNAVKQKRGHEVEYRMIASGGHTVWIRDTVSLIVENRKVAKLRGLMVDITEKKTAEEALRRSEEQLRQSQKMEAIGRLAGGIAHDFNNLLTAITGYGDLLLKGLGKKNKLRREAMEISKAAQRAADLTGQLLAFSRQQVLRPQIIDLNAIVVDMEMMLRRVIGEHIQLVTRLDSDLGAVKADPGQMHQVLLNLVVNARDAMPKGGEVGIETAVVELDQRYAERHPGVEPGAYVKLSVSDNGAGIDEETKRRLFEPFFTTKEQGKGTGLGLSTVYGIVRQSGGHISIDSTVGEGSTFQIYLPWAEKKEVEPLDTTKEAIPDSSPGTERILLVEDDESVRELASEILQMNGYDVVEACNGVEALSVFEEQESPIEIVVTDLIMPQMGGRELAENLVQQSADIKVLFLSGYTDSAVLRQGLLDPGSFFLQKPFTPAQLAYKVRQALDS